MRKIKIVADDKIPFLKGALESNADIQYLSGKNITREDIIDADGLIIRTRTRCDAKLLEGTEVKFIATATIGYDHIDTDFCRENNIEWRNAPGCNAGSVEQYIVSSLLTLAGKHSFKLKDKTLGIIGVGNVGKKVAKAAQTIGMKVLLNDPPRQRTEKLKDFVSLESLKETADIVSFHVPLNKSGVDKTLHLGNREFFESLKNDVIIINSSRGEVIDEKALKKEIDAGNVLDTVIDVWENEPLINKELLQKVGIATPHIAGYSIDGKANGTMMSVRAISRFFDLGMDNWKPENLPGVESHNIVIDCGWMDDEEIIYELYRQTYNISRDDADLRDNIDHFEELRGNYPVRREPPYFSVRLNNNPYEYLDEVLEKLGFSVLEIDCFC